MLNKTCTPNKTEDLNLSVFFLIKSRNKSETLAKRISCECKLKFDGTNASQIDGEISVDVSVKRFMYMYFKHTFFKQFYQHKRFCPDDNIIDEKSYKNILIYYIGYGTIKKT